MNAKPILIGLICILVSSFASGQIIGSQEIDDSKVTPWNPKSATKYQGVYKFGESEGESDLILLFQRGKYYGQIRMGTFINNGTAWIYQYENLTNLRIENNKFYSDKSNGEFVRYDTGPPTF